VFAYSDLDLSELDTAAPVLQQEYSGTKKEFITSWGKPLPDAEMGSLATF